VTLKWWSVSQPTRPTGVYRLTVKGEVIKLVDGINFSNGIMLSADRRQFYCNDTFVGTWVFDVQPELTLGNKRMLIDKADADGMALDAEGNLWITGFRSSFLTRLRRDGTTPSAGPDAGRRDHAGAIRRARICGTITSTLSRPMR